MHIAPSLTEYFVQHFNREKLIKFSIYSSALQEYNQDNASLKFRHIICIHGYTS